MNLVEKRISAPLDAKTTVSNCHVNLGADCDEDDDENSADNRVRVIEIKPIIKSTMKPPVSPKPKLMRFPDATYGYVPAASASTSDSPASYRFDKISSCMHTTL